MRLSEEMSALFSHIDALEEVCRSLKHRLERAKDAWPDHQIIPSRPNDWHGRDEVPPDGFVWASDGIGVWLIRGRGEPISKEATSVKYWTEAYIPAPPDDNWVVSQFEK